MLCGGCCLIEEIEENEMSKPAGNSVYGVDVSFAAPVTIGAVDAYLAPNIPPSTWVLVTPGIGASYIAGWISFTAFYPGGLPFSDVERSILWWSHYDDMNTWRQFDDSEYTIVYTSTSVSFLAFIGDKEPPAFPGSLWLLLMDGPRKPQGISPKVGGVGPV